MACGPISNSHAIHDRVVVRQRYRFGMSDKKSMEMPGLGCPGANSSTRPRPIQIDGAAGAVLVPAAIGREMLFMCAPAEFRGLRAFADEAVDGPGIHEFIGHLWHIGDLRVAFRDVHHLDAECLRELGPSGAA